MEYIRVFQSQEDATEQLAQITHPTLSAVRGGGFIGLRPGVIPPDPKTLPFYIENISNNENTIQIKSYNGKTPKITIYKSFDGEIWETMGTTGSTPITATIPANGKMYLKCTANSWSDNSWTNYHTISSSQDCNVGGNIMSLLYGDDFIGKTSFQSGTSYIFNNLFTNNTHLIDASGLVLPATTLVSECYGSMFRGCTELTKAPELPAETIASGCYHGMFALCSSLTKAPELPAETLFYDCYDSMFNGCTSLTTAPVLPATTLDGQCYMSMFNGCTSLTAAPALPAETLAARCYSNMFNGCIGLITAPELPATILAEGCYNSMFNGCTNLNRIKCLATDMSASNCTYQWVSGVAATGTFIRDENAIWTNGVNGIPSGWIIKVPVGIALNQSLNVATISISNIDQGTGYYTIGGGSQIPVGENETYIPITQSMNNQTLLVHGEFDGIVKEETLLLNWVDYSPSVTITEKDNYITLRSQDADTIQYKLGESSEYANYTEPIYIEANITLYIKATRIVSDVVYTYTHSEAVTHTVILPSDLYILCSNNTVTLTAKYATSFEYKFNENDNWIPYTNPFQISATTTVYAKASNIDGNITKSHTCKYVDLTIPFYIEDISGSENTVRIVKTYSGAPTLAIEKSLDGTTWETMGTTSATAITATVPANGRLYLRCNATLWASDTTYYNHITITNNCNVGGNIMSLLYGDNFTGSETTFPMNSNYIFFKLFENNSNLISAYDLALPATTLTNNCYYNMFTGCTSLTTAPAILPATTLANYCYRQMFYGCTSLTTAPELPATTLAQYCYYGMFQGCTALITAPELPATTLAQSCYYNMFTGCTSLTAAPILPATTLVQSCYSSMFQGCTNLNYVKCLATSPGTNCYNWLTNVAATGTFVRTAGVDWQRNNYGVPSTWTIEDAA